MDPIGQAERHPEFLHGTLTIAVKFKEGVVIGSMESRATADPCIASQHDNRLIKINDCLLGTMAGSAGACAFWDEQLALDSSMYKQCTKERISVAATSKFLANRLHDTKCKGLSVGAMICGWDEQGSRLYYIDSDGSRLINETCSVGAGSPYAYSVLDKGYKWKLSVKKACDLCERAIFKATQRDGYSAGVVKLYHMQETGWKQVSSTKIRILKELYRIEQLKWPVLTRRSENRNIKETWMMLVRAKISINAVFALVEADMKSSGSSATITRI